MSQSLSIEFYIMGIIKYNILLPLKTRQSFCLDSFYVAIILFGFWVVDRTKWMLVFEVDRPKCEAKPPTLKRPSPGEVMGITFMFPYSILPNS